MSSGSKAQPAKKARPPGASATAKQVAELREELAGVKHQLDGTTWLLAELLMGFRVAAAKKLAQQMQPQLEAAIQQRLMNGGDPAAGGNGSLAAMLGGQT